MPSFGGYLGTITYLTLGLQGLTVGRNPSLTPRGGLLQADTVSFFSDSVHKSGGRKKIGRYGTTFTFVDGDVSVAGDTITETAHGLVTGNGPMFLSTTGALPGGLDSSTSYWSIRVDDNTIKLATSYANAIAGTAVNITSAAGGGTHTIQPHTIVSLWDWYPNEGQQFLVTLASNGKLYIAVAGSTLLGQNQSSVAFVAPPTMIFVECGGSAAIALTSAGRMLAVFTGVFVPKFYQGTSAIPFDFTLSPTDWQGSEFPVGGAVHNGRLFAWGLPNKGSALYGSTIDDHRDFKTGVETGIATASSAVYLSVYPGVGLRIYYGVSHKGMLFLLKYPRGIFWLDDTDINPAGWITRQLTDAVGCAPTPHAGVLTEDGIVFMAATGQVYAIIADTQGGIQLRDISQALNIRDWITDHVNTSRLSQVVATWDPSLNQVHFGVPSKISGTGSTTNDLTLTFDFSSFVRGGNVRFSYAYRDAVQGMATLHDTTVGAYAVIESDYAGNVWRLGEEDRSINSALPGVTSSLTGYTAVFQTSYSNLQDDNANDGQLGASNKIFDVAWVEYIPNTGGTATLEWFVDGTSQGSQSFALEATGPRISPSSGNTVFTIYSGSGPTTASELGGGTSSSLELRLKEIRITGSGRRISFKITTSGVASEDAHVTGIYVGYRKAGQDVGRGGASA